MSKNLQGDFDNNIVFLTNLLDYLKAVKVNQFGRLADLEDMCFNGEIENGGMYNIDGIDFRCTGSRQTPNGVNYYFEMAG